MANVYTSIMKSSRPDVVVHDGYATATASALTLLTPAKFGILDSGARIGTGTFQLVLTENWVSLLDSRVTIVSSGSQANLSYRERTNNIGTAGVTKPTIEFSMVDATGAPTDMSGTVAMRVHLVLANATVR